MRSALLCCVMSCWIAGSGAAGERPEAMVWIDGGTFTMGWNGPGGRPDERPSHSVRVDGFWMDETEVTNDQFAAFVEATGYVTTAERPVDWGALKAQLPPGTPKPPEEMLRPGSLVFTPTDGPVPLDGIERWWSWVAGASWRRPEGPGSTLEGRGDHPVVQVSWYDARAYAAWAGKRLPTEAEWEHAAKVGVSEDDRFAWGGELTPDGRHMANIWQGDFPYRNDEADGFARTAPVKTYAASAAGLYEMAGNVWEWTADRYRADAFEDRAAAIEPGGCCVNPEGPATTLDPRNPFAEDTRVQKGGSFLCHVTYCESYRPSARMSTTPDSAMSHVGFRCVSDAPAPGADE